MINHIDYSQYAAWNFCTWNWYERYVLRRQKVWPQAMRDDALAIGTLFHAGEENWYAKQNYEIPQAVINKINPTSECLALSKRLIFGYVQTFPREQWSLINCERPLRFPLIKQKDGLAKIDLYFYIDSPTVVESGVLGYEITLKPGWWIQEYKTKSSAEPMADFMQEWVNKMQADFQMLALDYALNHGPEMFGGCGTYTGRDCKVNGLLVNVAEKPREYVPKRKCKGCGEYWNFSAWLPNIMQAKGGAYQCPGCNNVQDLKPVDSKKFAEPSYFRMIVERTPEQLATSRQQIYEIAMKMQEMEENNEGPTSRSWSLYPPNKDRCFDSSRKWGKECDFFLPHSSTNGLTTIDNPNYQEAEDYLGEVKED